MAMPAVEHVEDHFLDPDELKVPESPAHRQAVDLIALLAKDLLGPAWAVYRDMNWYPPDGGNAVAPDIMLAEGARPPRAKSYRQRDAELPWPSVVVEVPSRTDGYSSFRAKLERYRRLGVVAYVVDVEDGARSIERVDPDGDAPIPWDGRPMPQLGGLILTFDDEGALVARLSEGVFVRADEHALAHLRRQAEAARGEAEAARARVAELEARLRALGADPGG
jgi:hypothetical protein